MIKAHSGRTAPRQAILTVYETNGRWPEIGRALALDIVAAMNAANGFTLGFACLTAEDAHTMAPLLPAGVDLLMPSPESGERDVAVLAGAYAERGFERVITIAADAIGVTTRLLSTASSVLGFEPSAVGLTPDGLVFAVAARGELLVPPDESFDAAYAALGSGAPIAQRTSRLEPLTRLREIDDLARLTQFVGGLERVTPRTIGALGHTI